MIFKSLAEIELIEYSTSFVRSNAARISGTVVPPSCAILFTAFWIVKYSFIVGSTFITTSATKPTTMAQSSRPKSVIPR